VWEYINPYYTEIPGRGRMNMVYRAYRVPYEWIPQVGRPEEIQILPINASTFRVPGASKGEGTGKATTVEGVNPNRRTLPGMGDVDSGKAKNADFCLIKK
jgi:hypothetical protein